MNKGTVKFFNESKGYGFIKDQESDKEYFVHVSALPEGLRLNENDAVTFDVEEGDKGPKAGNVSLDDGAEAPLARPRRLRRPMGGRGADRGDPAAGRAARSPCPRAART